MILAELRGKLSRNTERMEDILTSNVFSFLKYSNRNKCLRPYLEREFGIVVSEEEAEEADFKFWYAYDDGTEPDVIVVVGNYYLLFEAKYLSGFGAGSVTRDPQTEREVAFGLRESGVLKKTFLFVPITADFYFKGDKGFVLRDELILHVRWTSWQRFAAFLEDLLENGTLTDRNEVEFASDLHELLDRKNLRGFHGYGRLAEIEGLPQEREFHFYDARGSTFRGAFIGFAKTLVTVGRIRAPRKVLFLGAERKLFRSLSTAPAMMAVGERQLFWEVDDGGKTD